MEKIEMLENQRDSCNQQQQRDNCNQHHDDCNGY